MVEGIFSTLAVVGIFAVVVSLLTLYVWRCNPHLFAMWKADLAIWQTTLRSRPEDDWAVTQPPPPEPVLPPAALVGKPPSARLQYWVDAHAGD